MLRPETLEYLAKRGVGLAPRMGPNRTPGMRQRRIGRSRLYLAKSLFTKDMDCGDAHIDTAIGNDRPRRPSRKYPQLSFARKPDMKAREYGASVAKSYSDAEQRDGNGRWTSGIGEHLGSVAGLGAGVYNAPKVTRAVNRRLKANRTVRGFRVPGIQRKLGRYGAAGLAAYGAVRVAGVAGGYVGRKIDEAVDRIGKGAVT